MPSLEESRRQVKERLGNRAHEPDHDDILASLQDEIDRHNAVEDDVRDTMRKSKRSRDEDDDGQERTERSMRFRFKDGASEPRKRKHRSHHAHHHKRNRHDYPTPPHEETETETDVEPAHPFPREPAAPDGPNAASGDAAFRDSLFDALADDEGAHYWANVYSQPIHVYTRPTVSTPQGELEEMGDEQYAAYVKTKMWERKHPEIMVERERSERQRREEEEERTKRREEFIRRREQAAWERAERRGARRQARGEEGGEEGEQEEYRFAGEANSAPDTAAGKPRSREYADAWACYLSAWDRLKLELLDERSAAPSNTQSPSQRIPWPVLNAKPVIKENIEDFVRHAPAEEERTRLQVFKAERVRWHPDKIQQRFAGKVDEGTMKLVTGVFQVVDAVFEEERTRVG